jgi:hypothetical protein
MIEQIENILAELKTIQAKLPELRDLFWLKIDRYNEADQQRGVVFDEKFEQQHNKLFRVMNSFAAFIERSFAPSEEEVAKEKALQKLRVEFSSFDDWNEEAKKALLDREIQTISIKIPQRIVAKVNANEEPNRGPKYQINNQPDKIYSIDSDFSHCRPCFFEFRNKKYAVNNWAMALKELANILYTESPALITEFIANDLSRKPLFSTETKNYLRPLEIANGLFVESNFSANQMCVSCKKLLDIYGIEHSEVKLYLDRSPAKM